MRSRSDILARANRIVVKLGSGLLTDDRNRLAADRIRDLGRQMIQLRQAGYELVLVSSGAVAAGMAELDLRQASVPPGSPNSRPVPPSARAN